MQFAFILSCIRALNLVLCDFLASSFAIPMFFLILSIFFRIFKESLHRIKTEGSLGSKILPLLINVNLLIESLNLIYSISRFRQ